MLSRLNLDSKERCVETIAPKTDWLVRIGHRFINLNYLRDEDHYYQEFNRNESDCRTIEPSLNTREKKLFSIIEEDPISNFDFIENVCMHFPHIVSRMAINLSGFAIDRISTQIFSKKKVNERFVEMFYLFFIPFYLQKKYSWYTLHFFIKASKAHPKHFVTTFTMIIKDTRTTNNVLKDYISTLDVNRCTELIKNVINIELSASQFENKLPVIYLLYKKCEKSQDIFHYVYSNLQTFNYYCRYNKEYGRLLLYFIQNLSGFNIGLRLVTQMAGNHFTAYKGPCLEAIDVHLADIIALQVMDVYDEPRIVIPRPLEESQL